MDLQGMINAMSEMAQTTRKDYHMSLGQLIDFLKSIETSDIPVVLDYNINLSACTPHSYRGYYSDLAIEPTETIVTVGVLLKELEDVLDTELTGYKGGEFMMDSSVPVWVSPYGSTGRALMGASTILEDKCILITKEVD